MATSAAARSVFRSSASSLRISTSRLPAGAKPSPSPFRTVNNKSPSNRLSRTPVQLSACLESMQPFHTVTASALMTSILSISRSGYVWLPACNDDS